MNAIFFVKLGRSWDERTSIKVNYLCCNMGSNEYNYTNMKLHKFSNLCGTIRRTCFVM